MQIYANPWPKTKQLSTELSSAQWPEYSCLVQLPGTVARGPMPFCDIVLHNLHLQLQLLTTVEAMKAELCSCGTVELRQYTIVHSTLPPLN